MAIYCSEECRNEDELRSRLSFANLNEERERSISAGIVRTQSSNGGVAAAAALANRAYSTSSLSPTFGPVRTASVVNSPWFNDSEGSEFEWHHKEKDIHPHSHQQHTHSSATASRHRATSSRDGSDIIATSGSEGRRFSDASDSSRLSVYRQPPTLHHPRARRSSSRNRGSNDSLASLGSAGYVDMYPTSSGGPGPVQPPSRPDMAHRSTSALSGGLRAMTPIHQQSTASTSASPRMTSPGRAVAPTMKATATSPTTASTTSNNDLPAPTPSASSGNTASILIRSNSSSDAPRRQSQGESNSTSTSLNNLASSTYIAPSSAKTFRPSSISRSANGGSFLKPSKSSATLALSAGEDVRATMAAERPASSQSPSRRPANAMSRGHSHHRTSHHTSTSSIPYLSCSPSSPGSGSMNSGRSNVSTDPSSSSVRGDGEYGYDDDDCSDDGEYRPLPRKSEDERNGTTSLSSYGLFYQRTPSTPSLPSLAHQSSYGRSPPGPHSFGARNSSRLSSSYDTKSAGGNSMTISSVFRERQNNSRAQSQHNSSGLRMTPSNGMVSSSPRRAKFDINAAYAPQPAPVRNHSSGKLYPPSSSSSSLRHPQADNTPTQSGIASRSHSFVGHYGRMVEEPVHEVVQEVAKDEHGRTRAPSITRTDLERIGSDRSIASGSGRVPQGVETSRSSSSTLQRLPSHLRPATLSPRNSHDLSLPSPPVSPGLSAGHGSHSAMQQLLYNEDNAHNGRPLLASARSKSRSSFTWDHLPPYVPQYTALDLDKVRRNKSGTSLHSVCEEDAEQGLSSVPSSQQSTIKSVHHGASRKRLFYFPEAE